VNANQIYAKLVKLDLLADTDIKAVNALKHLTLRDITPSQVKRLFFKEAVWYRTGPGAMGGTAAIKLEAGLDLEVERSIGEFWSQVYADDEDLPTSSSVKIANKVIRQLVIAEALTQEQADKFFAMGGGQPFSDITEADIVDAKAKGAAQEANQDRIETLGVDWASLFNESAATLLAEGKRAAFKTELIRIEGEL
jgi:hypothetical protein